jgi:F-type H+-transporting ATPase subunit a
MAVPVAAEKLFDLGPLPVTNSVLTGSMVMLLFVALAAVLGRGRPTLVPKKAQNAAEAAIEFMLSFMDQVTRDRKRSTRFLPIVGTLFLFILACNWMGILPGIGTVGIWGMSHGEKALIPLFRPATSDLNMTIAMGVAAVAISHIFGVMAIGFFRYWNKFIQIGNVWKAVAAFGTKRIGDAALGLFTALIEFLVGLIELISEAAKMVSLSLRLFGNIFAGEVLLHVLSSLVAYAVPLPFIFMELIVGIVQALVFSMLTLVYLTMATEPPHGEEQEAAHQPG